jgi:hypothetical protein
MFKLEFSTDNAAFEGDSKWMEIDKILRDVADRAGDGQTSGTIRDSNGNRVGAWSLSQPEGETGA